jgi:hypothetical protein
VIAVHFSVEEYPTMVSAPIVSPTCSSFFRGTPLLLPRPEDVVEEGGSVEYGTEAVPLERTGAGAVRMTVVVEGEGGGVARERLFPDDDPSDPSGRAVARAILREMSSSSSEDEVATAEAAATAKGMSIP